MKILLPFLVLLAAAFGAAAQKPEVEYDRFKDRTFITSATMRIDVNGRFSGAVSLSTLVTCSYEGQTLTKAPPAYLLAIFSRSKDWVFLNSNDLIIIADDSRIALGKADRKSDIRRGTVTEVLYYSLSQDDLAKLAAAKRIELQVGFVEGSIRDVDTQAFKFLLDVIVTGLLAKPKP